MSQHGLLLLNKPQGMTSHDVVNRVRRILNMREVGHAGTLDPLATGLMVLLLGEGTKISDYILYGDKVYRVKVKFGVRTNSLDITGDILSHQDVHLDPEVATNEALKLQGEFTWPVPIFSAAKLGGKKMYDFAHKGEVPTEVPTKTMYFTDLKVLSAGADFIEVVLRCSKGSFIRSWAAELGERLKVGGVVEELERLESAPYKQLHAIDLEYLENTGSETEKWGSAFIPMRETLKNFKTFTVSGRDEKLINNGQISHDLDRRLIEEKREAIRLQNTVGIKILSAEFGDMLAILEAQPNRGLKIRRVFKRT